MLKYLAIFVAVFVVVRCDGEYGPLPTGECKPCNNSIGRVFSMVAAMAKGMEPIEMADVLVCKKLIVTVGPSTITTHGKVCMISEPSPSKNKWQLCGFKLTKIHIECHIIPLTEFGKAVGIPLSLPTVNIPGFGSTNEVHQIINVDATDLAFDLNSRINFDEDSCNMTKLEMCPGQYDSMKVYLTGDSLFTKMGELITKPEPIRCALGGVIRFVMRHSLNQVLGLVGDKLKEVVTMLNCGDTDY